MVDPNNKEHQKKYKTIVAQLTEKNEKENFEFIIEPLISGPKVIYRIIDSVFRKP